MPRHSPDALTLRLRVRTTNGNAACLHIRRNQKSRGLYTQKLIICEKRQPLREAVPRHRFLKPIHNVKEGNNSPKIAPLVSSAKQMSSSLEIWQTLVEPIGIEPMT
jgi:hypothetical protein